MILFCLYSILRKKVQKKDTTYCVPSWYFNKTLDYYYEVSIDELVGSPMPKAEYEVMNEQGWKIKNNNLILYI
jgi:hypothetical protein